MRRFLQYAFSVVIFVLAFWGITYTSDWGGYEHFFDNDLTIRGDIASTFIFSFLTQHNIYDFKVAYRVHVVLMALLYSAFFMSLKKNPIPFVAIIIVLYYVPVANQIRYYVAFPLALLSVNFFLHKRKLVGILLGAAAISFHFTTSLFLLLCLFFYYVISLRSQRIWLYILAGVIIYIFRDYLIRVLPPSFAEGYMDYFDNEWLSSFAGGVYNSIPGIISLCFIMYYHNRIYPFIAIEELDDYRVLLTLSLSTCVLLPLGFQMQIFYNRMIITLLPIWIIYLSFVGGYSYVYGQRLHTSRSAMILILICILWQTAVPYFMGIRNTMIDPEFIRTISSYSF